MSNKIINKLSETPKSGKYAYHSTKKGNIESILQNGLIKTERDKEWEKVNKTLHLVAEEENISNIPDDRSECNFLFSRFNDIKDSEAFVVVNLKKQKPSYIYRSSYHIVTKIHDIVCKEKKISSPEKIIETKQIDNHSQRAYELSCKYWKKMSKENPPIKKGGELLIPESINPESITHIYKN